LPLFRHLPASRGSAAAGPITLAAGAGGPHCWAPSAGIVLQQAAFARPYRAGFGGGAARNGTGDGLALGAAWKATGPGPGRLVCAALLASLAVSIGWWGCSPLLGGADAGAGLGIGPILAEVASASSPSGARTQPRAAICFKAWKAALCNYPEGPAQRLDRCRGESWTWPARFQLLLGWNPAPGAGRRNWP